MIERADKQVTPNDVAAAYQLFLGRGPENASVIAEKLSLSLEALFAELVTSEEFQQYVLKPLLSGRPKDDRFNAAVVPGVRAWINEAFGLEWETLHRASTWGLLLLEVLAASQNSGASPDLMLPDTDISAIRRNLNTRRRATAHSSLVGAIEELNDEFVEGWAVDTGDPSRPLVVQMLIDGVVVGAVAPDRFRRDLQDAYGGNGVFGFRIPFPAFAILETRSSLPLNVDLVEQASQRRLASGVLLREPQRRLDALSRVTLLLEEIKEQLNAIQGQMPEARAVASFSVKSYDAYRRAYDVRLPDKLAQQRKESSIWAFQPRFLVACGQDAPAPLLKLTRDSLKTQSYLRWCWEHESGPLQAGDYYLAFAPGDELELDALYHLASAIRESDHPLLLTVDDDEFDKDNFGRSRFFSPRLKAAHDPWLLLQIVDTGALVAVEAVFTRASGFAPDALDGPARLKLSNAAGIRRVRHLPLVLHHRAKSEELGALPQYGLLEAARKEIARTGVQADIRPHEDELGATLPSALRIHPQGPQATLASVIIPTRDRLDLIQPCIEGLLASRGANATPFELVIVDNGGDDLDTMQYLEKLQRSGEARLLADASVFNWSRLNNKATQRTTGDVVIFLNDDTTPVSPTWCDELCMWASWPGVGVVGARLIYGDGTLQHAGIVTGVFGEAAHEGVGDAGHDVGYLGRHALVRRTNAVTGACMAVRRKCFDELGGFDETFAVAYNDIEFCLRAQSRGWAVLYAPQAVFHHFESKTRRFDAQLNESAQRERQKEAIRLHAAWGEKLAKDPFYNSHFERWAPPFSRLAAPLK